MDRKKPNISIVFIGRIDSGKSTTAGHLIYKLGGIDTPCMESIEQQAAMLNKSSSKYAWVLDKLKAERERGITIDITLAKFETNCFYCTVIDSPGHRDYIKNMITGATMADCAVLVIDSISEAFDRGISTGQTQEHIMLAYALGIKQMICCCNKMDATEPKYSAKMYGYIVTMISFYLKKFGYIPDNISFVPVSGLKGDNMVERSPNLSWYKGPTLLEALDQIFVPRRLFELPLRLPLSNVYYIGGIGTVAVGRVQTGVMQLGMAVAYAPSGLGGRVCSIYKHHERMHKAVPGDYVGFVSYPLRDVLRHHIKRGYVASNFYHDPARCADSFTAHVFVMNHPGYIKMGYTPVLHCHTAHVAVKFAKLEWKIDPKTFEKLEKEPDFLKKGDSAIVEMKPIKPMVVESIYSYPPLGRFVVRDACRIVAVGVITSVCKQEN